MKKAMKRLSAAIISLAMLVSLTPMTVFADETETDVPAATSSADKEHPDDSGKPKEKKKPAAETIKETEKPTETTKETEKPSAETSKETEKQTEETVKETEKPEETTKETEKPGTEEPKETEKAVPEESKDEEPAESGEPKETESSETEAPKESESDTSETTDVPEETEPSETDDKGTPDESTNSKAKKSWVIANPVISEDGILTWTLAEDVPYYEVYISGVQVRFWYGDDEEPPRLDLKKTIDYMIKCEEIEKSDSYEITVYSCDDDFNHMGEWSDSFAYKSGAEPIVVGEIKDVKFDSGTMTWTPYEGAYEYHVSINECGHYVDTNSFEIEKEIDYFIKSGMINKSDDGRYTIELLAFDSDELEIANWSGDYSYDSTAEPIEVGKITNPKCTDGILTWDKFTGATGYTVEIECCGQESVGTNSYKLGKTIDRLIKEGTIPNNETYYVIITAYNEDGIVIADWKGDIDYQSSASQVEVGEIADVAFNSGTMTWTPYEGAYEYGIDIEGNEWGLDTNSFAIDSKIDYLIKSGEISKSETGYYSIGLCAYDSDGIVIAEWSGDYRYDSTAVPVTVGKITNPKCSTDGILTWDIFTGASSYRVEVECCGNNEAETNSYNVGKEIDSLIKSGAIPNDDTNTYRIRITACDSDDVVIAQWKGDISYQSSATPVEVGEIQNIKFSNGVMTWNNYAGADHYWIEITDSEDNTACFSEETNSLNIQEEIADAIASGQLKQQKSYSVYVSAEDEDCVTLAEGTTTYTYNTTTVKSISSAKVTGISDKTYTGNEITFTIGVTLSGKTLTEGTDYTVAYENNINVGTAKVTITGIGNYKDTINKTFKINQAAVTNATVTGIEDKTYTGSAIEQSFAVNVDGNVLEKGTDFTVSYKNNTNVGKATVTITGKGNYKGTVSKTFMITAADISTGSVTGIVDKTYNGSSITQTYDLTVDGRTLIETTDYIVSYSDNINAGTATVSFIGKGNYTGTLNATFTINPANIGTALITGINDMGYTGSAITQEPLVTLDGKTLEKDTDYTVSYDNNTAIGTATVTIKGIGNYEGTIEKAFSIIAPTDISSATVAEIESQHYTGNGIEPDLTVTFDGKTLVKGTDYTVSYEDNVEIGTAKFTVTGCGIYTGTVTGTFEIVQAPNSLRAKGKTAKIKYKKKKQTVKASKLYYYYSKGQGTLSFKKAGGSGKFTVSAKTGNITVKKKTKKGTYRIKVKIKAAGNSNYLPSDYKTVTVVIKIKK